MADGHGRGTDEVVRLVTPRGCVSIYSSRITNFKEKGQVRCGGAPLTSPRRTYLIVKDTAE